ncbi:alpha-amylase family glycosyl hydrolase [Sediminibacter sp. Hel_I_10]|uniref:alpha-amylase family glycosyl hydrolase n=1 Tax=Sediminibacter sp. Hel_I_10 TaxID=1392490 RepID=UPI00047C8AB6|nr:alpha-amylase family glycosyl hydrolase [Sediminibacter sp. Hel_I_10]
MIKTVLSVLLLSLILSCNNTKEMNDSEQQNIEDTLGVFQPKDYVKLTHPEWSKNAAIYQLNTRQFSEEGTFKAAQSQLPRLKDLGIDIIWLMPIHAIGAKNRKGSLGSPYSVKDYYSVNPEFGTLQDLKNFVKAAHDQGMYVILDWVANHTAWDNILVEQNPDWYAKDYKGDFRPTPWWDWSDIIDLDYSKPELRKYMTEALKYWVVETDIDGYRCDVAGFVPIDFWNNVRQELDAIKPVFMLAEWESRDLHAQAFDMTYAWSWNETMHKICKGEKDVNGLYVYYSWNESAFPKNSMRMTFVSNHDMNSWEGTMYEQFGDGLEAAIVLSVVGDGMPLIYNGQEAGNNKRLEFFEKDLIQWKTDTIGVLYQNLFALMKSNTALWHGKWGATMIKVPNSDESEVLSFVRQNEKDKIFAVFNFSEKTKTVTFKETLYHGNYRDLRADSITAFDANSQIELKPWSYRVFIK